MFCKNCGNEVENGAKFCGVCGAAVTTAPAPEAPAASQPTAKKSTKSYLAAGLLGIFLGAFGVHNFYLGFTGKAIAQLLITVLSCFALSPVSGIWGLIEGILYLCKSNGFTTDADGNELID